MPASQRFSARSAAATGMEEGTRKAQIRPEAPQPGWKKEQEKPKFGPKRRNPGYDNNLDLRPEGATLARHVASHRAERGITGI